MEAQHPTREQETHPSFPQVRRLKAASKLSGVGFKSPFRRISFHLVKLTALWYLLAACAPLPPTRGEQFTRAVQSMVVLKHYFDILPDPEIVRPLQPVADRLFAAVSSFDQRWSTTPFQLIVVRHSAPLALTPGAQVIAISTGLLRVLAEENQLAFVIAHEIGHEVLGHLAERRSFDAPPTAGYAFERELAADRFGVGLMILAGYDPHGALAALAALRPTIEGHRGEGYPDFVGRQQNVLRAITASRWIPPGTTDRREYQRVRMILTSRPNF